MSIFLFLLMIFDVNALSKIESKIIGGIATTIKEFPYAVRFYNSDSFCSGCILNSWTVLTAAHCVEVSTDVSDMMIGVGSSYLQDYESSIYDVTSFVIHEDYSKPIQFAADIALLFIKGPINFSRIVQKAILSSSMEWANTSNTDDILVYGWGWTKTTGTHPVNSIMRTTLKYVPLKTCERYHKMKFTEDMFCLYGDGKRDTCQGDSGGGVEWKGEVIGIVSHGDGCAQKKKPSVYINVWYHRKWIEKQMELYVENYCKKKGRKKT